MSEVAGRRWFVMRAAWRKERQDRFRTISENELKKGAFANFKTKAQKHQQESRLHVIETIAIIWPLAPRCPDGFKTK